MKCTDLDAWVEELTKITHKRLGVLVWELLKYTSVDLRLPWHPRSKTHSFTQMYTFHSYSIGKITCNTNMTMRMDGVMYKRQMMVVSVIIQSVLRREVMK